jgi:hypothetical protein
MSQFDPSVLRAMARWPGVPDVYGWLGLDTRGRWRLRGEVLAHRGAVEFINRNYAADARGCWFFQNGPQRVFVALDYTPWVYHVGAGKICTHTDAVVEDLQRVYVDDAGRVLFHTARGIGVLLDTDVPRIIEGFVGPDDGAPTDRWLEDAFETLTAGASRPLDFRWGPLSAGVQPIAAAEVPRRFGFVRTPAPPEDRR